MLHMIYHGPIEYLQDSGALVFIDDDCRKGYLKAQFDNIYAWIDGQNLRNPYAHKWHQMPAKDFHVYGGAHDQSI